MGSIVPKKLHSQLISEKKVFALKTDLKKLQLYTHIALKFVVPFSNSLANCILVKKMTFKVIVLYNVEQNMNL